VNSDPQIEQTLARAQRLHQNGELAEAETIYRDVLAQNPHHAGALHLLGMLACSAGQWDAAADLLGQLVRLTPESHEAHNNLGVALQRTRNFPAAVAAHQKAIALRPDSGAAYFNLGIALKSNGQLREALAAFQNTIRLMPQNADAFANLGNAFGELAQVDAAIAAYRQAILLQPDHFIAHNNLGMGLRQIGEFHDAIAEFTRAIELNPSSPSPHHNLILAMHYHPSHTAAEIGAETRRWNQQHAAAFSAGIAPHTNDPTPDRRLRVGYVSPDFRDHVAGWNLLPLLRAHDRRQFEIFCYSNVARPDSVTEEIRCHTDSWQDIRGWTDARAAGQIRDDRIDILVDLAVHTAGNRLLLFARKPAPVQVTYLGYCGTTGLATMDYRLSDPHLDPPGADLSCYSEQTIHLPSSYWCYEPGGQYSDVAAPPLLSNGFVTFGCLNNFAKVSPDAMKLWASVLAAVPNSRLLVHCPDTSHRPRVLEKFAAAGLDPDRLELIGRKSRADYFQTYHRIDVALDPFPFGGGITTCDALWMGVPVISLSGNTAVGRGGRSILSNIGLPELVAYSPDEYVHLASQARRWTELRPGLRDRMKASPLMDAQVFARNIEAVYRSMWRNWCAQ
jgi:predicted O-linked N-acetylglucosamine transferase (SPINDLY family)